MKISTLFDKKWKRLLIKTSAAFFLVLITLQLIAWFSFQFLIYNNRLPRLVNKYSAEYLYGQIDFESANLHLWSEFPYVTIRLNEGKLLSGAYQNEVDSIRISIPTSADTLLQFKELMVSIDLPALLNGSAKIKRIQLVAPRINAFIAKNGKANWDIFPSDSIDTVDTEPPVLQIDHFRIAERGVVSYENQLDSLHAQIAIDRLLIRAVTDSSYRVSVRTRNTLLLGDKCYIDSVALGIHGELIFDLNDPERVAARNLRISYAALPMLLNGYLQIHDDAIVTHMQCKIDSIPVMQIVNLTPNHIVPEIKKLETNLMLNLNSVIAGSYHFSTNNMPSARLDLSVNGGYLHWRGVNAKLDDLILDASANYDPMCADSVSISIKNLLMRGTGINLQGNLHASNILKNPTVNAMLQGDINLETLSEALLTDTNLCAKGKINLDVNAKFKQSDLALESLHRVDLNGKMTLEHLLIDIPQDSLYLMVRKGVLNLGAHKEAKNRQKGIANSSLQFAISADTAQLNLWSHIYLSLSDGNLALKGVHLRKTETDKVIPITGSLNANLVKLEGMDSSFLHIRGIHTVFSVAPLQSDRTIPVVKMNVISRSLSARGDVGRYFLRNSAVEFEATLEHSLKERTERNEHRLDSLQSLYPFIPRDSLLIHSRTIRRAARKNDELASGDIDLLIGSDLLQLMRRWRLEGSIKAERGRITTPYFPLQNRVSDLNMLFTMNELHLNSLHAESGGSQVGLTGKVTNIRRALAGNGNLQVDLQVNADTLNFNELISAINAGIDYSVATDELKNSFREANNEEELHKKFEQNALQTTADSALLIVPANVELDLRFNVKHGRYADFILNQLEAQLVSRERCLQISRMNALTNAGEISLTALYATRSKQDITTGFDLEIRRLQIDRIIELIPSIDTMIPMLRSFEGVVDCQIAATTALDSCMNFLIPSVSAAVRIQGKDMVLLDGETFADISKTLRFKNKKRNVIDQISVDMLVRNNQIEVFPFLLEIDRYQTAISGIQQLDMNYNYHISVLKSPLPLRFGIDVRGNLDDFHYRIAKPRYRDGSLPSHVALIDQTRMNLREQIVDIFKKGVDAVGVEHLTLENELASIPTFVLEIEETLNAQDSLLLIEQGVISVEM